MDDRTAFECTRLPNKMKWFAPASEMLQSYDVQYLDVLAGAPRKVDVFMRVDEASGVTQSDLLERLAHHPKVGTVIVYGLPYAQRALFAVRAAMLGINVRFCETEEEVQVLLNKRRSRVIVDNVYGIDRSQTALQTRQ